MDNQVNNTFNPVGLVGGVKKEGISEDKINEISNNFNDIKDQLNRIEDIMISVKDNLYKRVETIKLESVMPTPVNIPEEQVEQPIDAPVEQADENKFNKTEDLTDLSRQLSGQSSEQLENVNVISEPQPDENVPETNTIDLSTPVPVPNSIQKEETSNIESAVELANLVANEPADKTTQEEESYIPVNLEELVKEAAEPNFVQPEVSQIQDNTVIAENNNSDSIITPEMSVAQEQSVETVQTVPTPAPTATTPVSEVTVAQEPVQPQLVESAQAEQTPAQATTAAPEMQVAQEPVQPQLVESSAQVEQTSAQATTPVPEVTVAQEQVVAAPAPAEQTPAQVTTAAPEVTVAQEQPVQTQLAGPTQVPTVQSETQNIQEELNNIEVVNAGEISNATALAQQRSLTVTPEQQQALIALMMSAAANMVSNKIFTNKMSNQG